MEDAKEDYVLKWSEFQTNLTSTFDQLRRTEDFVDVTLSVGGRSIKCHKVVLSAASAYFSQLLAGTGPADHPVIILGDAQGVTFAQLSLVVDFIYTGSVTVPRDAVDTVTRVAELLGVRGLVPAQQTTSMTASDHSGGPTLSPPSKKRRYEEAAAAGDSAASNSTAAASAARSVIQCSNGTLTRLPAQASAPAGAAKSLASSRLPSTSLRGSSVVAGDLENYSDIRPDILEMIKEEQKAKLMEPNQNWSSHSSSSIPGGQYCYQNQLQNMWQKCWNQNANVFQGLRYRERGPMKSWRSETMAEAIWSVLQEGLSLSQAARKHDIPYPTFVLYANRVHNMLGPSPLNGYGIGDLRPKGRGRPQRILLGQWPEEHVREVIRAVVFREGDPSSAAASSSPPAPTSSPQLSYTQAGHGEPHQPPPKTEPVEAAGGQEGHHGQHPLAAESRAAQAAFEAQMKQFYNNPFASQLLAASSKMLTGLELPFLQSSIVKVEAPDEDNFEDAVDSERGQSRGQSPGGVAERGPVDLATNSSKSIEAIASKLVGSVTAGDGGDKINDNVFNCSEEIRKTMRSVGDSDTVPLVAACNQERKSV